jgi:hypothetical protein
VCELRSACSGQARAASSCKHTFIDQLSECQLFNKNYMQLNRSGNCVSSRLKHTSLPFLKTAGATEIRFWRSTVPRIPLLDQHVGSYRMQNSEMCRGRQLLLPWLAAHWPTWLRTLAGGLLHTEARVRAMVSPCGICGGRSGFLRVLRFSLPTPFHRGSPYSYIIWSMNNKPVGGCSSETRPLSIDMDKVKLSVRLGTFYIWTTLMI